jgi:hypothetical protein
MPEIVVALAVEEDVVADVTKAPAREVLRAALPPCDPRAELRLAKQVIEQDFDRGDDGCVKVNEDHTIVL